MTDYLQWQSDLTANKVFAKQRDCAYPTPYKDGCVYLTSNDDGHGVLIYVHPLYKNDKHAKDSSKKDRLDFQQQEVLTPPSMSVRTKINEYGGKPFVIDGDVLLFSNQYDQRLYAQSLSIRSAQPEALSPANKDQSEHKYANVNLVSRHWFIAVVETVQSNQTENKHSISAFKADGTSQSLTELVRGADFYSNLVVDMQHKRVAWVQWNHPRMPWDDTQLWVADIHFNDQHIEFSHQRQIELGTQASICQLQFAHNGHLFFAADFANDMSSESIQSEAEPNYWNLYAAQFEANEVSIKMVSHERREFGYPHWQYGDAKIVRFDAQYLLAIGSTALGDRVYKINQDSLRIETMYEGDDANPVFAQLASNGQGVALAIMYNSIEQSSIVAFDYSSDNHFKKPNGKQSYAVITRNKSILSQQETSLAEHIEYTCNDGKNAYGFYYAPCNRLYSNHMAPPLIVLVHGGPTAQAMACFDLQKQFWTQHGFAVFDVNHRGSSGYGRRFRDALYGHWGQLDTADIAAGVSYLIDRGLADHRRVCIHGKSAGGYAVLCALTQYSDVFSAGACYYGIGNLATLANNTHKFEKYYTDRLIGEQYHAAQAQQINSLYYQRSPIHYLQQLKSPMIVFQGGQDKIVPPIVAKEIIDALEQAKLHYEYVQYENEGHGFRSLANKVDALHKELCFFREVLK